MRPTGSIPAAPAFYLENDALSQVLCQIRFPTILRIRQEDAVIGFQDAVRAQYPRYTRQEGATIVMTPEGVQQQPDMSVRHFFGSLDDGHSVILSTDFVAIDARKYEGIQDFSRRISDVVGVVREHFTPGEIERVGLRFINEFRFSGGELGAQMARAIEPHLLGAAGTSELLHTTRATQQVVDLVGSDSQMLVRHGLQPFGGSMVEPTPFQKGDHLPSVDPCYVLDVDAFTDAAIPFDPEGVDATLRAFNDDIRSFFAWGVREEYRVGVLGQRPAK